MTSIVENGSSNKSTKMDRVCFLITGMHRSGTSALARTLNIAGCDLPKNLVEPTGSNNLGHWESRSICELNDELLESCKSSWHDWSEFSNDWRQSSKVKHFTQLALEVLSEEFEDSRLFVLKDPRMARVVDFWINAIESLGATPVVIFLVRNPVEVASSLKARNNFNESYGQLLWLRNAIDFEYYSRDVNRIFISYDQLLKNPTEVLDHIKSRCDVCLPHKLDIFSPRIREFISSKHRHHKVNLQDNPTDPGMSQWVNSAYEILDRWTNSQEKQEEFEILDGIREQLKNSSASFGKLVALGRYFENENLRKLDKIEKMEKAISEQEKEIEKCNSKISLLHHQKSETMESLAERFTEIAKLTDLLQNSEQDLAEVRAKLSSQINSLVRLIFGAPLRPYFRKKQLKLRLHRLNSAGLFDADWYVSHYEDIAEAGLDPARHFVEFGAAENRSPNPIVARAKGEVE